MVETSEQERTIHMTPERAQVIVSLFQAAHPSAAAEISHFVDSIIHSAGDDVPDLDQQVTEHSGASVSLQSARAATEFVMAAMLIASG